MSWVPLIESREHGFFRLPGRTGDAFYARRITVRETDAPITRTIEARLPWLRGLPTSGARISGQTDHIAPDRIFADRLWRAHFTTFDPGED